MNYWKSSLIEAGAEAVGAEAGIEARETAGVGVGVGVPLPSVRALVNSSSPVGGRLRRGLRQVCGPAI